MIKLLQDWIFKSVHGKNLIYNVCCEDPRCDRKLLDLQDDSRIVMITSAGCNALEYLLDDPAEIHCVDLNFRQNSVLELKRALFLHSDYTNLFDYFGDGVHEKAKPFYEQSLRTYLPDFAQKYWDRNIHRYFNGKGLRNSYYFHSTSGALAYMMIQCLKLMGIYDEVVGAINAKDLETQTKLYKEFAPKLFDSNFAKLIVNQHVTMSLAGVPKSQQKLVEAKYENGIIGYAKECFEHLFMELPMQDNYFWRLIVNGKYTKECCPEYLKEDNFPIIRSRVNRIETNTCSLSQYLKENPSDYSHYILLDHQDWLAANDVPALEEEWELILKNSRPGTRILLRSAAEEVSFFPDFVLNQVDFSKDNVGQIHYEDRFGLYASVYLGIVK